MSKASKQQRQNARKMALQALYQYQLSAPPVQDVLVQFLGHQEMEQADRAYFQAIVEGVVGSISTLQEQWQDLIDRPLEQLDPIEKACLWLGTWELLNRIDVPYKVVINESVELAKSFGGEDGHRYVNSILDKVATNSRTLEVKAAQAGAAGR